MVPPGPNPDERSAKRYPLRNFTIRYSEDNLFSFIKRGLGEEQALINMSNTGLAFLTPESVPAETPLKMQVDGEVFDKGLELKGEVVYCHQVGRESMFRVGVRFTRNDKTAEEVLDTLDESLGKLRMRVMCSQCGTVVKVKRRHEGKTARCPKCRKPMKLEEVSESIDSALEEKIAAATEQRPEPERISATYIGLDLARLVKAVIPNRTALAVFENVSNPERSLPEISTSLLAGKVNQPAFRVGTVLKRLVDQGFLYMVETGVFNFTPTDEARKQTEKLRAALADPDMREKIEAKLKR